VASKAFASAADLAGKQQTLKVLADGAIEPWWPRANG
jgi:hypothetical protein